MKNWDNGIVLGDGVTLDSLVRDGLSKVTLLGPDLSDKERHCI